MPNSPLVSAIVPTLDRPRLVERAVESIDAQEYSDIEIIVVDDSTYDEQRPPSFKDVDADLEYIHSQNPTGLSIARNRGIREASGGLWRFSTTMTPGNRTRPRSKSRRCNASGQACVRHGGT